MPRHVADLPNDDDTPCSSRPLPNDVPATEPEVWPCNVWPVRVFVAMSTQWRVGFGGAYGLDFNALPIVEQRIGCPRSAQREVFAGLMAIQSAVLQAWAERRELERSREQ